MLQAKRGRLSIYLTMRLRARGLYEVIVKEGETPISLSPGRNGERVISLF